MDSGGYDFSIEIHQRTTNGKLNSKVLILNQNYEPMSVINARKAIVLLYLGKAELIESCHGWQVRSVSMAMPFPSIIRLSVYVRIPYKKIILSRKNILRRDGHRCQFCGRTDISLTVDHVLPVSRGGEDTWENLVCACVWCNNKKGDRTPDEARMPLHRTPMRPNHVTFIRHFVGSLDERWKPYLFCTEPDEAIWLSGREEDVLTLTGKKRVFDDNKNHSERDATHRQTPPRASRRSTGELGGAPA